MPVRPTFPGVYIEEVPSGVRTIVGVATSVAAFIDYFARGPMNRAIQIFSFADFEREFGGLDIDSEASYAIQQCFLNGGSEAFVVRVGRVDPVTGPTFDAAQIDLQDETPANSLRLTAGRLIKGVSVEDPGTWGNFVRADVDYDTTDTANLFNLTLSEVSPFGTRPVLRTETFRNLTMTPALPNVPTFVEDVVNEGSRMVQVQTLGALRPAQTGTVGDPLVPATLTAMIAPFQLNAQLTGDIVRPITLARAPVGPNPAADARGLLETALQGANPLDSRYTGATVQLVGGRLRVLTGRAGDPTVPGSAFDPGIMITFTEVGAGNIAADLGLLGVPPNVQQYSLGGAAAGFQLNPVAGSNGTLPADLPAATDIIGVRANKTGLFALEDVDIFNILCIPRAANLTAPEPFNVYSAAEVYCLERRAFLIVDIPFNIDTVPEMKDFLDTNSGLRSRNAAVYFPRLRIADPLNQFRLRDFAPSGTMAGLYARTDNDRGVWKAPAGIDATLRNVNELRYVLTDPENGTLNPLGIDCLRTFPIIGTVSWGARTLDGADVQASEWKYLPVRRFALFLEESLYRGTKFAVFEPNDEPLWSQIRLNVGAFLQTLFRQGAFQGQTPRQAYFVKCDKETTTQNDINLGIVNILVGFAPLKPAEFVIIKISQIAGQIEV
ncbi:MAG: hypothetical protein ND866_27605 [Pyrinomonadaceae bacterium]|nr:hypothetical protein [Pyrinomonadaceae bacterium]